MKILVIEDEKKLCDALIKYLEMEGYETLRANDGLDAVKVFRANNGSIDLVLLDLMLPFLSGTDVLREIRKSSSVPVIMLTAVENVDSQIESFSLGADDYITKPYSLAVVKLHIEAVLKRVKNDVSLIKFCNLTLNTDAEKLSVSGNDVYLTPKEYELLKLFMNNTGKVFTREMILDMVWDADYDGGTRTIDTIIKQLRKKIGTEVNIRSVYGRGYCFEKGE